MHSRHRETREQAGGSDEADNGKNGVKRLDLWYILMVGPIGFADELDVIEGKGESGMAPWCFAGGTRKIELLAKLRTLA